MKNDTCPKCGSQDIIPSAGVRDYDRNSFRPLSVFVKTPKAEDKTKTHDSGELRAWICGKCGYTELCVANFRKLWEEYKEGK